MRLSGLFSSSLCESKIFGQINEALLVHGIETRKQTQRQQTSKIKQQTTDSKKQRERREREEQKIDLAQCRESHRVSIPLVQMLVHGVETRVSARTREPTEVRCLGSKKQ
jgi:hypothetical protein